MLIKIKSNSLKKIFFLDQQNLKNNLNTIYFFLKLALEKLNNI
jgi:hypothetical protein